MYVYNPSVNANGPLRFEVSTTDAAQRTGPFCVSVEEDTCPAVVKFRRESIQEAHATVLRRLEHEVSGICQGLEAGEQVCIQWLHRVATVPVEGHDVVRRLGVVLDDTYQDEIFLVV